MATVPLGGPKHRYGKVPGAHRRIRHTLIALQKNGAYFTLFLLRPTETSILGLRTGRQAGAGAGSWRAGSRAQLGLGRTHTARGLSRVRSRFARPRQQRLGSGG